LFGSEAPQRGAGGFHRALTHDFEHAALFQIIADGGVVVPPAKTLFINPHQSHLFEAAALKAADHGALHDAVRAFPMQAQQQTGGLNALAGFKDAQGPGLEMQCPPTAWVQPQASPWSSNFRRRTRGTRARIMVCLAVARPAGSLSAGYLPAVGSNCMVSR
jgi:hypothetical protein